MKKYLYGLLAASLSVGLSACADDESTANEPKPGDIAEEAADETGEAIEDAGEELSAAVDTAVRETANFAENELSQSNARGFTARNVIGATVRDASGESLAIIDDLLFSNDRQLRAVVIRDGAFMGLGGDNAVISADRFRFGVAGNGEMIISAEVNDGDLRQMTESLAFEPTDGVINPGNLLSVREFLDRPIVNANGDEIADPFDILYGDLGQWRSLIVSVGGVGAIGNRLVEINPALVRLDASSSKLLLDDSAPDLDALSTFEYR
ncbi:PRC-barrel domain-containing protein [Hyphococcus sp.]|uniref:PRC-barrel domain-containing protein n=1 Tax=Hyphococcus sp. TaxID=2038636 RepID=UPI003CCBAF4C